MAEDPEARRKRLRALREDAERAGAAAPAGEPAPSEPVVRFRNYTPRDENLPHEKVAPARPDKEEQDRLATVSRVTKSAVAEPLLNLAPKKPNWDLKRDIEKDMAKLDRQTELAIIEILRRKVAAEGEGSVAANAGDRAGGALDLAVAVRQQERADELVDDDA